MSRIRAVVYGIGETGSDVLRLLVEKDVEIVGAIARSDAQIGRDVGEATGLGRTLGVPALYPWHALPEASARLDALAKKNGVTPTRRGMQGRLLDRTHDRPRRRAGGADRRVRGGLRSRRGRWCPDRLGQRIDTVEGFDLEMTLTGYVFGTTARYRVGGLEEAVVR
jgi:hypothetical protein